MDKKVNQIIDENLEKIKEGYVSRFFNSSGLMRDLANELENKGIKLEEITNQEELIKLIKNSNTFLGWVNGEIDDLKRTNYHQKIGELTRFGIFGNDTDAKIRKQIEHERERTIKKLLKKSSLILVIGMKKTELEQIWKWLII